MNEKVEDLANDRIEALGRANLEAEAAAEVLMRDEADRLLADHRERTAQLREEMKVRGKRSKRPLAISGGLHGCHNKR